MKKITVLAMYAGILLFSSFASEHLEKVTVQGIVLTETGKPLGGVLVYTTAGEEEALTRENGEFRVETSRKAPFALTAEHWDYQKTTITVTDPGKRVTLKLVRKK